MKLRKNILDRRDVWELINGRERILQEYTPRDLKYWKINTSGFNRTSGSGVSSGSSPLGDFGAAKTGKNILKRVTNIDIKKAYPYAFRRLGFISQDVLNYLLDLDKSGKKISRLKGMGILAKQKLVNKYNSGKLTSHDIKQDVYLRSCFFMACKIIDDIMISCSDFARRDFLFFWVDGIYINTGTKRGRMCAKKICRYIKKSGYKYSREILCDFKYGVNYNPVAKKEILNISFRRRKTKKIKIGGLMKTKAWYSKKPKTFSLPLNHGLQERLN